MDMETKRREIEAKISLAMDVLEKAQNMISVEWREPAAHAALLYIQEAANVANELCMNVDLSCGSLIAEYLKAEADATRPV